MFIFKLSIICQLIEHISCFVLVDSTEREIGQSAPLEFEIWLHDMLYDYGMMMLIKQFLVMIENFIKWSIVSLNSTRMWCI